jgi:hypothetical protein
MISHRQQELNFAIISVNDKESALKEIDRSIKTLQASVPHSTNIRTVFKDVTKMSYTTFIKETATPANDPRYKLVLEKVKELKDVNENWKRENVDLQQLLLEKKLVKSEVRALTKRIEELKKFLNPIVIKDEIRNEIIGDKKVITVNGENEVITIDGENEVITIDGENEVITVNGENEVITIDGENEVITIDGENEVITIDGENEVIKNQEISEEPKLPLLENQEISEEPKLPLLENKEISEEPKLPLLENQEIVISEEIVEESEDEDEEDYSRSNKRARLDHY